MRSREVDGVREPLTGRPLEKQDRGSADVAVNELFKETGRAVGGRAVLIFDCTVCRCRSGATSRHGTLRNGPISAQRLGCGMPAVGLSWGRPVSSSAVREGSGVSRSRPVSAQAIGFWRFWFVVAVGAGRLCGGCGLPRVFVVRFWTVAGLCAPVTGSGRS